MTPLSASRIVDLLVAPGPPWRVQTLDEVTSTSDLAREAGRGGETEGVVIFAESQTHGRGQRSNRWLAPKGQDLMFSVLFRPQVEMSQWPRLTTLAALAVCRAVEAVVPLSTGIKWPNDIYIGRRKVGGLLAETFSGPGGAFLVLGVGLNVNNMAFAPELQGVATSLLRELPAHVRALEREAVAASLLDRLGQIQSFMGDAFTEVLDEVRQRSLLLGKQVRATVNDSEVCGRAVDINHEGYLILQLMDGSSLTLSSAAEVRLIQ